MNWRLSLVELANLHELNMLIFFLISKIQILQNNKKMQFIRRLDELNGSSNNNITNKSTTTNGTERHFPEAI
jgi:hypothetical protein